MLTISERTFKFGVKIVKLVTNMPRNPCGMAIANQIVRSGTSIGANVEEAQNSGSKKEFVRGITIALKEARETLYWLKIAEEAGVTNQNLQELRSENLEIIKILTSSIKKAKIGL